MENTWYHIQSNLSNEEVLLRLQSITVEAIPFFHKKKSTKFLGTIRGNNFKLRALGLPTPTEFEFKIVGDQIYFIYQKESMETIAKAIVFGLFLPLALGLVFYFLFKTDLENRTTKILTMLITSIFICTFFPFASKKSKESNDDYFLKPLAQDLQSDLQAMETPPL